LKLPYDTVIENVHLSDSLMVLGYKIKEQFGRDQDMNGKL
ncbi:MAG TPA: redox-sensing transcriptional repressor Rex, partial [Clostridia bacterium]